MIQEFFRLRQDRNGKPMSEIFGPAVKHQDGWWSLPIKRSPAGASFGEGWEPAWHGTNFNCIYSILAGVD